MAARLLYLTLTRTLSWLALLCRRRSALIAETLTLRHEITVLRRQLGHGSLTEHQDEEIGGGAAAASTLRALDDVTDRLIRHTGSRTAQQASAIASWVRETATQFEHAPIQNYVPILVENLVRNRIALTTP